MCKGCFLCNCEALLGLMMGWEGVSAMEAVVKGGDRDVKLLCNLALAAGGIGVDKLNCKLNLLLLS